MIVTLSPTIIEMLTPRITRLAVTLCFLMLFMILSGCEQESTTSPEKDTTPPTVVSTSPAHGATNVAVDAVIFVEFSETLLPYSVTASRVEMYAVYETFTLRVPGNVDCDSNIVTFGPLSDLVDTVDYSVTLYKGIQDAAGNRMAESYSWVFSPDAEIDLTPPIEE